MSHDDDDKVRRAQEDEHERAKPGARGDDRSGSDADTPPGAPGESDTPLGDTDQHSDVPSQ